MHLLVLVHLQKQRYIAASALRTMSLQFWPKTSLQSLHTDRQFMQWLTLKHIVSIFTFIELFLYLINSQYGVWKHLLILGAGFNQQKWHSFSIYGIENLTPQRQGPVQRMITFLSHYIAAGGAASPRKGCCCWQLDPPIETYPHPIQMHSLNLPNPFPVTGPSTGFGTLMSYHNSPGSSFTSLPMLASVLASPPLSNFPLPVPLQMVHHIAHQFQIVLRLQLLPHLCYIIQSCSLALLLCQPPYIFLACAGHSYLSSLWQKQFENAIARLTISAGLPCSWVDNIE